MPMDDRLAKLLLENNILQRQQNDERRLSLLEKLAIDGLAFEPIPIPGVVPTPSLGYTIKFESFGAGAGLSASQSYWVGPFLDLGDTLSNYYVYPPKAGYIKYFENYVAVRGTFSSGEIANINLYKNGSVILTNTATFDLAFAHGNSSNPLAVDPMFHVVETDQLIVEIATPAWSVEPVDVRLAISLYINNI